MDITENGKSGFHPENGGTSNEALDLIIAKLQSLAETISASKSVVDKAVMLYKAYYHEQNSELLPKVQEMAQISAVLYIASVDVRFPFGSSATPPPPQFTISDLLKNAKISIKDLLKCVTDLKVEQILPQSFTDNLVSLEKKYCITYAMYIKFNKIFSEMFQTEASEPLMLNNFSDNNSINHVQKKRRFAWTLYICAKASLIGNNGDLHGAYSLLLCCLEYLLRGTPSFMLKSPFDEMVTTILDPQASILPELCNKYQVDIHEAKQVSLLFQKHIVPQITGDENLDKMCDVYLKKYTALGDINELLFEKNEAHLIISGHSNLSTPMKNPNGKENGGVLSVKSTLNAIQQLQQLLTEQKSVPKSSLLKKFQMCSVDPTEKVKDRVEVLGKKFVQGFSEALGANMTGLAEQRWFLVVKLYYKVLEAMLLQEEERLLKKDFAPLLNFESFHLSLLACSVEIVFRTYGHSNKDNERESGITFPWILQIFDLQCYDFFKVIECFIKAEPELSRDIVRYLQEIENKILSELAWKSDSSLHVAMGTCVTGQSVTSPRRAVPPSPLKGQYSYLVSPMNHHGGIIPNNIASLPMSARRTSQSLRLFQKKLCLLAYTRLESLCDWLIIPDQMKQKCWTCLEHCIKDCPELMTDRHVDQILMCSIYSVCKVVDHPVTFKDIREMYNRFVHAESHIYKHVRLDADRKDTIIEFYNQVFIPRLREYLTTFGTTKEPTLSPAPCKTRSPLKPSPRRHPALKNVYISPMKESPTKQGFLTPRTKRLYCFGEGLSGVKNLSHINQDMRNYALSPRFSQDFVRHSPATGSSAKKRIHFDDSSPSDAAPSAKRMRTGDTVRKINF